ncbi:MAG: oxygen-independent coproporphyrinogen III oxidase [Chlorobi bacterium]|nr:oxygen-independent coproporphyrinogen III oxidase [Chlorobiota bacterium]
MLIDKTLLDKYNVPVPRYTSYPPANYFTTDFDYNTAIKVLEESNNEKPDNISFYLHIPFCSQLCYYCGCNTHITRDKEVINDYISTLKKEILMYKNFLSPGRKISQIHWGGGTPDYLDAEHVKEIMELFDRNFSFISNAEIAMECHPAHLSYNYMDTLLSLGFNRISIGVQDFDTQILKTVNRELPAIPVNDIVKYLQEKGVSVNLDFVYGLPLQTEKQFARTIDRAIQTSPDRIALFSYAHVPSVKPHQKILEQYGIPEAAEKTAMFETAYKKFTDAGYVSIGLDHFARPDDELSVALDNKMLSRNFQGYCTTRTTGQVYAVGVSGISQLNNAFFQNTKDLKTYSEKIKHNIFPFEKVYFLNNEEKLIGHIIKEIMSNRYLSYRKTCEIFNLSKDDIFRITRADTKKLAEFEQEGLISINEDGFTVTRKGAFFLRNIASLFDPLMKQQEKHFSKAL